MNDKLPRKPIIIDKRGRITIPDYMREKLGISDECPAWIELYPNDNPKCLLIKKA